MAKYTLQVRDICESLLDRTEYSDYMNIRDITNEVANDIFSIAHQKLYDGATLMHRMYPQFAWAFFDGQRIDGTIASKILRHYYTREICAESYGLWKLWLNKRVIAIAPKYEKWFIDHSIIYGWDFQYMIDSLFSDVNKYEEYRKSESASGDDNGYSKVNGLISNNYDHDFSTNGTDNHSESEHSANSIFPQGNIIGHTTDFKNETEKRNSTDNNTFADTSTHDETVTGDRTTIDTTPNTFLENDVKSGTKRVHGNSDPYGIMVQRFKKATVNVEDHIIHEFDDLFLNLY